MSDNQRIPLIVRRVQHYFPDVDRVADATKPIRINVTKRDVETAKEKTHDACAMARACLSSRTSPSSSKAIWRSATAFPRA